MEQFVTLEDAEATGLFLQLYLKPTNNVHLMTSKFSMNLQLIYCNTRNV